MVGAGTGDGQSSSGGSVVGRKASRGSGGAIDVAAQLPINSARKMPSAEGAMRAPNAHPLAYSLLREKKYGKM